MTLFDMASFEAFQDELAAALQAAKAIGTPDAAIRKAAAALGDYFSREITPKNPEQRLLKSLWDAASEAEQQAIASAVVKMLERRLPLQ